MAKAFKDWEIDDIIAYCQEHKEVEWLKATGAKMVECKIYPRVKVQKVVNGEPQFNAKGKPIMVSVADKDAKPTTELRPITFVQLKSEFAAKFGFGGAKKDKEPTMWENIANL